MALHESEREQVEALQRWWRENGRSVLLGVVVALALVVGWQQWRAYQERMAEGAATAYQTFLAELDSGDLAAAAALLESLRTEHGSSTYPVLASLDMAARRAEAGELEAAEQDLVWARQQATTEPLTRLARLHLARVRLARDDPGGALSVLEPVPDGAYGGAFQELRGDALAASGDASAAVEAYDAALAAADLPSSWRDVIRMKRDTLATGTAFPAS